ncbi:MAG: hypothetical protein AAF840_01900 [Bacteroidota bacterium]
MADATQTKAPPSRPKKKKPSWANNLKVCIRTVGYNGDSPFTTYSEKRHKTYDRELKHCFDVKERFENNPKYGAVEWAAVYDVSGGYDRGPKVFEYWIDKGQWQQIIG